MATVKAVNRAAEHVFSKNVVDEIFLEEGLGVRGDAHRGKTVQHLFRIRQNPNQPNLRQVHLIHQELIDELRMSGFDVMPGAMGENITTIGLDVLGLPTGTVLAIGPQARLEVTGLRNPCAQLEHYQKGLMAAVLDRNEKGELIRKAGIMAVVIQGGPVHPGDEIVVHYPPLPHQPLKPV